MASARMDRWLSRLADLPSLQLPTDYPRPAGDQMVEAQERRVIDDRTAAALVRLGMFDENEDDLTDDDDDDDDDDEPRGIEGTLSPASGKQQQMQHHQQQSSPTPFHLLLAAFVVLLHRYTGDTDLVVATSSASSRDPLLLRIKLDPQDSFWSLVRTVQFTEQQAEDDKVPYQALLTALGLDTDSKNPDGPPKAPLFRVRFFDELDSAEHSFVQQTSLTSDLTLYVSSEVRAPTQPSSGTATPTSAARTSMLPPRISLTLSYNSLLFSSARIAFTIDQLMHVLHHAAAHPLDPIGSTSLLTAKQRKILPDPRKDLEWCGYRGAITDIFTANAQRFPDRTCIVESLSPKEVGGKNGLRTFTYKQIDEASNMLAHYLVKSGVEREEVVTVYSTRGVDLVVAVMGVLKAGATFSVIGKSSHVSRA
ncbi:large subunit of alpha-aminoadipate reductase [Microbotryomycetes sp. JL201]|nr:large subunit of alpha-aminoadipate reductase [Microbotryomycetes sp. JL201]